MLLAIIMLIGGLVLILVGANGLTDGASALAKRMGISDLVVGLTVVAFGTSAPELAISIISALNGASPMAVGNIVGSNIFNILVIIGITACIIPIKVERGVMINEIPLVILSSIVLLIIGLAPTLDGTAAAPIVSRADGLILLLFFVIFMRYTLAQARGTSQGRGACGSLPPKELAASTPSIPTMPVWRSVIYVTGGLAALIFGGDWFVDGASRIASQFGVSDAVIGLTIVAAGTSLPELATSIVAALKGRTSMAIGNVIGSNIFNIFMVLGVTATIHPLGFGDISVTDLVVLTVASLLFWIFGWFFKERTITRYEGAILFTGYIAYTVWLLS